MIDPAYITTKTRGPILSYYEALAYCDAYRSAASNAAGRADNYRIGFGVTEALMAATSAVVAGIGARKANDAASNTTVSEAMDQASSARTYGYFAAAIAGVTTAVAGGNYLFGPVKTGADFNSVRATMDKNVAIADKAVTRFQAEMAKTPPNTDTAIAALAEGTHVLNACPSASGSLRWDEDRIDDYRAAARNNYRQQIALLEATNTISTALSETTDALQKKIAAANAATEPTIKQALQAEAKQLEGKKNELEKASIDFHRGHVIQAHTRLKQFGLALPQDALAPGAWQATGRRGD